MRVETVNLTDVLYFQEGPGVRNTQFTTTGVKLLNVGNINNGVIDLSSTKIYISKEEAYGKYKHFLIDEGDLLIASSGIVVDNFHNKIALAKAEHLPLCLNTSTIRFKTRDSGKLDIKYFSYYLKTLHFSDQLRKLITGSAQLNFGPSHLKQISLPLPPLPVQQRIAEILDTADALLRKDQELLKKYDELAQAIFIDMFGDPVNNEKGWEVKKLKEISTKILSGNTPKGGSNVYVKEGIAFYRSQNVWKNRLELNDIAYIDKNTHQAMKNSSLKYGDLLMTKTGRINTENSSLGRAAIFLGEDNSANINGHVYLIRLNKEIIKEFVLFILTTNAYREHIRNVCVGGIDKRQLNKEHLEEFPIIFPSIKQQALFANRIRVIEKLLAITSRNSKNSEKIFQTLIQKAFTGELVN